tara:strand:+ start:1489 stop:2958 length:1470 start_codon:yes stop_codon:yes gene_type:complete
MAIGSISFPQTPVNSASKIPAITNWTPLLPYTVKQTSISGLFYFKFILEIRETDASGTILGKIKQRHNGYATVTNVHVIFDVGKIINSQLEPTYLDQNATAYSIHTLGANSGATDKLFSTNSNQLIQIYVKAYQQYSSSASASPAEEPSPTVNDTLFYIAASLPLETPRTSGGYFQGTQFQTYQTDDANGLFLSDLQDSTVDVVLPGDESRTKVKRTYVQWDDSTNTGDYHTMAFLNGETDFNSDINQIRITYYNSLGGSIGISYPIINDNDQGGADPNASGGEVNTDAERLLYVGVGPQNLQSNTYQTNLRPSNYTDWVYYRVQGEDSGNNAKTEPYYFIKQGVNCKGYKTRRLAFRNSLGCWDYFNFTMKSTQSLDIKRESYSTLQGEFNSTEYSYNNFDRGIKNRKVEARMSEVLNTDFITEEDAELIEKLVISDDVFILENADTDYTVPVIIKDSTFVKKTNPNDGIKIQYTIQIEYANPINTNS